MATMYECTNERCVLGHENTPGYFTGGMTQRQKALRSGMPMEQMEEGKDYGEGICPECGQPGKEVGEHESLVGEDPHEELHQEIAAKHQPKIAELREMMVAGDITSEEFAERIADISDEAQYQLEEGVRANADN